MTTASPPPTFETERLRLRRPRLEDANEMFRAWAADPQVTQHLVWRPHSEVAESVAHIERCRTSWDDGTAFVWFMELNETSELIGSIASRPGSHGVNLGYLVARPHWGRRLMTEALAPVVRWWLAQPAVFRVWATTDIENHASARVLENAGFRREGVLRSWEVKPNLGPEPRDAICYSITKT